MGDIFDTLAAPGMSAAPKGDIFDHLASSNPTGGGKDIFDALPALPARPKINPIQGYEGLNDTMWDGRKKWQHYAAAEMSRPGLNPEQKRKVINDWQLKAQGPINQATYDVGDDAGLNTIKEKGLEVATQAMQGYVDKPVSIAKLAAPGMVNDFWTPIQEATYAPPTTLNRVAYGVGSAAPAMLTGNPAAMATIEGLAAAGEARGEAERRRALGQDISTGAEWTNAAGQGAIGAAQGYLQGKLLTGISPAVGGTIQPALSFLPAPLARAAAVVGTEVAGNALVAPVTHIASNLVAKGTIDPTRDVTAGAGEAALEGAIQGGIFSPIAVHHANNRFHQGRVAQTIGADPNAVQIVGRPEGRAGYAAQYVADSVGLKPVWFSSPSKVNAFPLDGRIYINARNAPDALPAIMAHEALAHAADSPSVRAEIEALRQKYAPGHEAAAEQYLRDLEQAGFGEKAAALRANPAKLAEEATGKFIEESLQRNPGSVDELAAEYPNLFQRMVRSLGESLDKIGGGNAAKRRLVEQQLGILDKVREKAQPAADELIGQHVRRTEEGMLDRLEPQLTEHAQRQQAEARGDLLRPGEGPQAQREHARLHDEMLVDQENAEVDRRLQGQQPRPVPEAAPEPSAPVAPPIPREAIEGDATAGKVVQRPRGFKKTDLEEKLLAFHREMGGTADAHEERILSEAANGDPFMFAGALPEEVRTMLEGRPELKRLVRVSRTESERNNAGGPDALAELGEDKWLTLLERQAGNNIGKAVEFAKGSGDPKMAWMATLYERLPQTARVRGDAGERDLNKRNVKRERNPDARDQVAVDAHHLQPGATFEINGDHFEVVREGEYRMLRDGDDYPEVPLDYLDQIPVDKGTLKEGQPEHAGAVDDDEPPFSVKPDKEGDNDLFGRPVFRPQGNQQGGLFHEPVKVAGPKQSAEDGRIARKFSDAPTGNLFGSAKEKGPQPDAQLPKPPQRQQDNAAPEVEGKPVQVSARAEHAAGSLPEAHDFSYEELSTINLRRTAKKLGLEPRGSRQELLKRVGEFEKAKGEPLDVEDVAYSVKGDKEDQADSPEFRRWFGGSKTVDAQGKPAVFYHGTNADFTEFDRDRVKSRFPYSFGLHFTDRAPEAAAYAVGEGGNIQPVYLKAENPLVVDTPHPSASIEADLNRAEIIHKLFEAKKAGTPYDSVIIRTPRRTDGYGGQNVIVFDPAQVKSATGNRGTFDPANPDVRFSVRPEKKAADEPDEMGLFSALARTIRDKMPARATAEQVRGIVANAPGVKADEVKWTGLNEWLASRSGPVSKQEVMEFLAANRVEVKEVVKGGGGTVRIEYKNHGGGEFTVKVGNAEIDALADDSGRIRRIDEHMLFDAARDHDLDPDDLDKAIRQGRTALNVSRDPSKAPRFQAHTLPGGENYRELLLTLPDRANEGRVAEIGKELESIFRSPEYGDVNYPRSDELDRRVHRLQSERDRLQHEQTFRSAHWDEPNVLAHVRFSDRTDADGKKVLHVEEIQSDWHQKGREKGYRSEADPKKFFGITDEAWAKLSEAERQRYADDMANGEHKEDRVPDAPFSKTWHELALKRMIRWAAENGYDRVAWTPGEQQAARYDLSKQVDSITAVRRENGKYGIWATKQGERVLSREADAAGVAELVGKDLAEKITAQTETEKKYSGVDLRVGGEGMKGFYDKIIPDWLNKYARKWGVKVGKSEVDLGSEERPWKVTNLLNGYVTYKTNAEAEGARRHPDRFKVESSGEELHSLDVTPEMKKSVMEDGQPMFSVAPTKGSVFDLENENWWDAFRRKVQDEFLPVQRMQRDVAKQGGKITEDSDPYLKQELFKGKAADQIRQVERDYVQPIVQKMSEAKLAVEDVDEYLYALHAPERNAYIAGINKAMPDGGSGLSNAQAAKSLAYWKADPRYPVLQDIAAMVHKLNAATLDKSVSSGILDPAEARTYRARYKNYVPLRTDMEADGFTNHRPGQGFNIKGKEFQTATGRSSLADSPLTFSLMQAQEKIVRAEKNAVGQAMLKLVRDNPDPDLWTVDDYKGHLAPHVNPRTGQVQNGVDPRFKLADNVLSVKEGGKAHLIEFKGEAGQRIAASMKRLGYQDGGAVVHALGRAMRVYASLQTNLNPEFILPNLLRDVQTAVINTGSEQSAGFAGRLVKNIPKAWKAIWDVTGDAKAGPGKEYHDAMREYLQHGGKVDAYALGDFDETGKQITRLLKDANPSMGRRLLLAAKKGGEFIDRLNGAVETGTRLSAYVEARKAGMSAEKAASLAKNLTVNFNKKGEYGTAINSLYLFSNASIQGNVRMFQALAKTPRGRKIAAGLLAAGLAYGLMAPGLFGKDEQGRDIYDTIPEQVRASNLLIPAGGGTFGKVPLPYGFNAVFGAGRLMGETMTGHKGPGDAGANLVASALDTFNPLGQEGSALQTLSPTILDPFVQYAENKDWTGKPIVPEQSPFGAPKPQSQLAMRSTSEMSKAVARWLNSVTGGDEVNSGKVDVSPAVLDHFIGWATGGTGRFLGKSVELPSKLSEGDVHPNALPIASRFLGERPQGINQSEFYALLKKADDAKSDLKHYEETDQHEKAQELREERATDLGFGLWAEKVREEGAKVRKEMDAARESGDREGEKAAREKMDALMGDFVKAYRENALPKRWAVENELAGLRAKATVYNKAKKELADPKTREQARAAMKANVMTAAEEARYRRLQSIHGAITKAEKEAGGNVEAKVGKLLNAA